MSTKDYAFIKYGDKDADSIWHHRCQRNIIPYVVVRYRTKLADVEWDYITFPNGYDDIFKTHQEDIKEKAFNIFKKYAYSRSEFTGSGYVINFRKLYIDNAKLAAQELYDLINSYVSSANE